VGELADQIVGPRVLPVDRVPDRDPGAPVPEDRGLALVGDAEPDDLVWRDARLLEDARGQAQRVAPDLHRVVLDPAGARVVLLVFHLNHGDELTAVVEEDAAGGRRALVDRDDIAVRHGDLLTAGGPEVARDRTGGLADV